MTDVYATDQQVSHDLIDVRTDQVVSDLVRSDEDQHLRWLVPARPGTAKTNAEPAHPVLPARLRYSFGDQTIDLRSTPGAQWIDVQMNVKVSVVIPTLNEAANLRVLLPRLPKGLHEVILVDGFSTDDTVAVARELYPSVTVVNQTRKGKGNALAHGFAAATGDIIVMLDADGSADPAEMPLYITTLLNGADFAKGSRYSAGGGSTDLTGVRRIGNGALNTFVNTLYGTRFSDLCYGYNVFWAHCLPALDLDDLLEHSDTKVWGDGFEIETMIATRAIKANLRMVEVPSFEHDRIHGESNLNTWRDGFRVLRTALVERGVWYDKRASQKKAAKKAKALSA